MSRGTSQPRTANAQFVTDRLLVGGDLEIFDDDLAVAQLEELVAVGVTDLVDVREEWDDSEWVLSLHPELRYHHLGVDDAGQVMADSWFDTGVATTLEAFAAHPDARVLVHCHMGVNRGPSLAYAVLLAQGYAPIEALDLIRQARPIAFVAYAEDALDWWLRRSGRSEAERATARARLATWRERHHLDVTEVIRKVRREEDRRRFSR